MNIIETNWNWRTGLATRSKTNSIILHHAAAKVCTAQQVDNWHKGNGWTGIGYHFFIRKDGTIYRGRPEWAIGAHASGHNSNTIGVCVEGDYSVEKTMPEAQKNSVKELLLYLKGKYPQTDLKGHRDVGATGCPGDYYPMSEMINYFNNESEELTMAQYEELKRDIDHLREEINEKTGYFNYIDKNMNEAYKPTIQKLVDSGKLLGNEKGELMLTTDMMRILTILDRAGVF